MIHEEFSYVGVITLLEGAKQPLYESPEKLRLYDLQTEEASIVPIITRT